MISRRLTYLLPLLLILTILVSLLFPAPVSAADTAPLTFAAGEPPPPPGEKAPKAPPPADKPTPPSSDTTYTADAPPAAPDGAPGGTAAVSPLALSVDAIANAAAVLIGPQGNPLPFATRDTASVLATMGDVYFKGTPGSGPCDAFGICKYEYIYQALADFPNRNGSGLIYANGPLNEPGGVYVKSTLTLNLSKLTGLVWTGQSEYSPSILYGALTIQNMLKGFTVDGFYLGQGIVASHNAGTLRLQNLYVTNPYGDGINVSDHNGNIDLSNVSVFYANGSGARLDNTAGTGKITISNSSFNNNDLYGIIVDTNGSAQLERVETNYNQNWEGALLTVKTGATVKDSRFNTNQGGNCGLKITGSGVFTLQNVEAQSNTTCGIWVYSTSGDVSINGAYLAGNMNAGLLVGSKGNVTLNNITSVANTLQGAWIDNSTATTPKTVTVTNSIFSSSISSWGLRVETKGNVTLNHIRAENNNGTGILVDNRGAIPGGFTGVGSISLLSTLGLNEISGNQGNGLEFYSKGAITVKGVLATGNAIGFILNNCAIGAGGKCLSTSNLSISAVDVSNSKIGTGMSAFSGGAIYLDNANFLANQYGIFLRNADAITPKAVTVTRSTFNNTISSTSITLDVASKGNITLNKVEAKLNTTPLDVIRLDNCQMSGSACLGSGSVSVLNTLGPNLIIDNSNASSAISISSHSAVTLNGVISEFNYGSVKIVNEYGTSGVKISNSSFSHNSHGWGLYVDTKGSLSLTAVNASLNTGTDAVGAYLLAGGLSVIKSQFNYNGGSGLVAYVAGSATLNNVSASFNQTTDGASVASFGGAVSVLDSLGPNVFNYNGNRGLYLVSGDGKPGHPGGNISISGVTARYNKTDFGVTLGNLYALTPKTVTAQRVISEYNGYTGLAIFSKGNVTLNAVSANYNKGPGVTIDNCIVSAPCIGTGSVTLLATLGANSMNFNQVGLLIDTTGSVTLNNVTANSNTGAYLTTSSGPFSGAYINNTYATSAKPVVINQGAFNYNHAVGLMVLSKGVITLSGIDASYNTSADGHGAVLMNQAPGWPAVNVLGTLGYNRFNNNDAVGLYIITNGNVTLNKLTANENGYLAVRDGATINAPTANWVSITCGVFNHNRDVGLEVFMASGVVKFASVGANANINQDIFLGGKIPYISWTICGH